MSDVTRGRASSASRRRPIAPRQRLSLEEKGPPADAANARVLPEEVSVWDCGKIGGKLWPLHHWHQPNSFLLGKWTFCTLFSMGSKHSWHCWNEFHRLVTCDQISKIVAWIWFDFFWVNKGTCTPSVA